MGKPFENEKRLLPAFPRTPHLPDNPNMAEGDVIASEADIEVLESDDNIHVEEKIDGASVGMTIYEGRPVIRNRDHILRKGYVKDTPAKKQFASIWNWWYDNQKKFEQLHELGPLSVYGEWMVAQHGIHYDRLPDWFIAYDLYNYESGQFLAPDPARKILKEIGFAVPPILDGGLDLEEFDKFVQHSSAYYNGPVEGAYIKISDGETVTHRFKMVRPDYVRGKFWDGKTMLRNSLVTPQTHIVTPKDKRITPKCCESVQAFQAVFLDVPVSFHQGDNDTPPKWVITCKSDQFDCDAWREAHFCPFCGTPVPEVVRVSTGDYKVCTCTDSGYRCDTCGDRLSCCQCLPPTHRWGPKETDGGRKKRMDRKQ